MSYTIRPAAPQQTHCQSLTKEKVSVSNTDGAFEHLAPVVDLLSRSLALPKYQQAAGARRWQMKLARKLATATGHTWAGLKSFLALVGGAAVLGAFAMPLAREDWVKSFSTAAIWEPPAVVAGPIQAQPETQVEREQRGVTEYIARRYRVSDTAVAGYVSAAYRAGAQYQLDPLLILAVMAVESRYNPVAESVVGAKGLMQVMPKFHLDKLMDHGGEPALLEPEVNILVGAQILREYQRRLGDMEAALQMYAGAYDEPTAQYSSKVLAERARLEALRQTLRPAKPKKQQSA
jgi:soluble lytic murein transglycosylase-like protein